MNIIILQSIGNAVDKSIDYAFKTSPDTVYQVLVGVLLLIVVCVGYALWKYIDKNETKLEKLNDKLMTILEKNNSLIESNIKTVEQLGDTIEELRENGRETNKLLIDVLLKKNN